VIHIAGGVPTARVSPASANDSFGLLHPDEIVKMCLMLHRQHRSAWTHELDLQPWSEKF
jgi:hypothetical protein